MPKKYKPRAGSMAFYPRVKAKSIIPKFNSYNDFEKDESVCKPVSYYGLKVGMMQVTAKNAHKNTSSYGHEIVVPVTIIETPDLKVSGARFYKKKKPITGKDAVSEFLIFNALISKKIKGKKSTKKKEVDDFLKNKEHADDLVLLCYLDTKATTIGQKKPILVEIPLSGKFDDKITYFKDKLNKTIPISEVFDIDTNLDVKSITKGHGFTGPVKRFGIKIQRPKAQQIQRHVGSIGPWHPATVMHTVPRAGQYGFHNRTSYIKKLLVINSDVTKVNPKAGFKNYGVVRNTYVLLAGNVPGVSKRVVALRKSIRNPRSKLTLTDINIINK
jgi:large subunit ribosomal protein L3